jgi:hypothetical protein
MISRPTSLDRRLLDRARLRQPADPVTVLVGGCGCGRTERLRRLQQELGVGACQYIDLERVSTTPERCYEAIVSHSPFVPGAGSPADRPATARAAYDALLAFLMTAHGPGGAPATFLLDEILEIRTFESFPGLRTALPELARALAHSASHFVVSTRFATRAERWIQVAPERFEIVSPSPMDVPDVREALGPSATSIDPEEVAASVHALVGGQPSYVRALVNQMAAMRSSGAIDCISALAASLSTDGELAARCRFSYELRLHRARGYGALKAILDVLADTEPLTLTAVAQRLERTPGSTKDYLSWLQDVDLITCDRKRYRFTDPILRLWVRLHGGPTGPDEERVATEVQTYALGRLREMVAMPVGAGAVGAGPVGAGPVKARPVGAGVAERPRAMAAARSPGSGIIEID